VEGHARILSEPKTEEPGRDRREPGPSVSEGNRPGEAGAQAQTEDAQNRRRPKPKAAEKQKAEKEENGT
jgi:hypothetical protein